MGGPVGTGRGRCTNQIPGDGIELTTTCRPILLACDIRPSRLQCHSLCPAALQHSCPWRGMVLEKTIQAGCGASFCECESLIQVGSQPGRPYPYPFPIIVKLALDTVHELRSRGAILCTEYFVILVERHAGLPASLSGLLTPFKGAMQSTEP